MELVRPWVNTNRLVCGYSYFASVGAALSGLRFIGVVKTSTKKFPMKHLSEIEMQSRGERSGCVMNGNEGEPSLLAFVWMSRDRRYFISSASSLKEALPYNRIRWRQTNDEDVNADPERMELNVPQPKACQLYYETCSAIDDHNRYCQS